MGCVGSKDRKARSSDVPITRSLSVPVHHPVQRTADSYHVVALTSSTYGTLKLDPLEQYPIDLHNKNRSNSINCNREEQSKAKKKVAKRNNSLDPSMELRAKTWLDFLDQRISQKAPLSPTAAATTTQLNTEPETINTWELMEGLEDTSPLYLSPAIDRSFSFPTLPASTPAMKDPDLTQKTKPADGSINDSPKPLWLHSIDDSIVPNFDPEVISTFRKAIDEMSPRNPVRRSSKSDDEDDDAFGNNWFPKNSTRRSIVQARINAFQGKIDQGLARKVVRSKVSPSQEPTKCPPGGEHKAVLYFTTLRGIRNTYEDCCNVRLILQGMGVRVDERDVSMHYRFREELDGLLGDEFGLPSLFVKGKYLGGAEEVRRLHEAGELGKALEGCGTVEPGLVCEGCGDVRFVPCEMCSGSCKVYDEEGGLGFQRCPDCNENGIVRCPACC